MKIKLKRAEHMRRILTGMGQVVVLALSILSVWVIILAVAALAGKKL